MENNSRQRVEPLIVWLDGRQGYHAGLAGGLSELGWGIRAHPEAHIMAELGSPSGRKWTPLLSIPQPRARGLVNAPMVRASLGATYKPPALGGCN